MYFILCLIPLNFVRERYGIENVKKEEDEEVPLSQSDRTGTTKS